jgi:hypothetical protein
LSCRKFAAAGNVVSSLLSVAECGSIAVAGLGVYRQQDSPVPLLLVEPAEQIAKMKVTFARETFSRFSR